MTNALRDENRVTVGMGVSSVDSATTELLTVDPSTDYLMIDLNLELVSVTPATKIKRDQNRVTTLYGISSDDGETLVPIRTNDSGELLIEMA